MSCYNDEQFNDLRKITSHLQIPGLTRKAGAGLLSRDILFVSLSVCVSVDPSLSESSTVLGESKAG